MVKNLKKYFAEFIGTFVLVFMGCGTAMALGTDSSRIGYLATALAFGLSIIAMAYSIGNISGCHVNPAVSLAVLLTGGMNLTDFAGYVIAQFFGAFAGAGMLDLIFDLGKIGDKTHAFGTNGIAGVGDNVWAALLVEIILTCIFVIAILGVTSKKARHGSFGGLVIGLTLTFVHIIGIKLTGTSVNPARSFGPALIDLINKNEHAFDNLWVFIVAPLLGAVLAVVIYKFLESGKKPVKKSAAKPKAASEAEADKAE